MYGDECKGKGESTSSGGRLMYDGRTDRESMMMINRGSFQLQSDPDR